MMEIDDTLKIIFSFGSSVYGTITEGSHKDFIAIGLENKELKENKINLRILQLNEFLIFTEMHEISMLECISLLKLNNKEFFKVYDNKFANILITFFNDVYNKKKLKNALSQKASNSFIKAKKKILSEDENSYVGLKSLFHSIRILDFGKQILDYGFINDFKSCKDIWNDILNQKEILMNCKNEIEFKENTKNLRKLYNEKLNILKSAN